MEQFLKEKLSIAWKAAPEFKRVFQMEHAALNRHDIPYFMTTPESRDLWTKDGVLVEEFFSSSALDNVKRRIQSFSVEDRDNQCWMIRASVGTLAKTHVSMKEEFKEEQGDWSEEEAILIAIRIGERLQKLSYGDNEINWLGLHGSGSVWRLRPLSVDLYDGLAGVILFLAFLGEKVQSECFLDLVRRSLHTVRSVWNREKEVSLGAYNGWLGVLYTLMHLSDLWNEPSYLEWGRDIVKRIADPSKDEVLDWIGGSAGAIHVLLSFFERIREERAKRLAIQCGEHLLNQSVFIDGGQGWNTLEVRPLTGIAHGAAGIALALARLFHVTGDKRFFEAVTDALNWERSQFSSEDMNWIDWRGGVSKTKSIQWCAGAPGVGLSRIYLHSILKESYCLEEVRKAFEITYLQGFGDNDSLCHGNLGNLLFLQKAAAILNDPVYQALFEARRSQVLASLKKGWRCGTPNQLDTPGLMVGLSGIGLGLLKLVDDRIPCVLSLQ
jgi:type 2 lantibiotic biosynthesis protein LanM